MSDGHIEYEIGTNESVVYFLIDSIRKHPELNILPVNAVFRHSSYFIQIDTPNMISLREISSNNCDVYNFIPHLILQICEMLIACNDYYFDLTCFELSLDRVYLPRKVTLTASLSKEYWKEIRLVYLPVTERTDTDPVNNLCCEILKSMNGMYSDGKNCYLTTATYSLLESISIHDLKQSISSLKEAIQNNPAKKSKIFIPNPFLKTRFMSWIENFAKEVKAFDKTVISSILFEFLLIIIALLILRNRTGFQNHNTPILLIVSILIICVVIDILILYCKISPLARECKSDKDDNNFFTNRKSRYKENVFKLKEEKTMLLSNYVEPARIAMLCSGIPGTVEEGLGLKAYILVDDFLIGRDNTKVDLKLECLSVGRIHARIIRKENLFFISDLGSRNGTYLDNKKLKKNEEYLLPDNCRIRLADQELYFVAN